MGQKSDMTANQRGLLWAVIMIISLTMLILGIVLTIRAVKDGTEGSDTDGNTQDQPGMLHQSPHPGQVKGQNAEH